MNCRWTPSRYVDYGAKEKNYEWTQNPEEVVITVKLPSADIPAKALKIVMKPHHLYVGYKEAGKEAIIDGDLAKGINVEDSVWTKTDDTVEITLAKGCDSVGDEEQHWWPSAIKGDTEIDLKALGSTKYLDDSILKQVWEKKQAEKAAAAAAAEEKKD